MPVPAGYTLETPGAPTPKLPPGYVLETGTDSGNGVPTPPPAQPSFRDRFDAQTAPTDAGGVTGAIDNFGRGTAAGLAAPILHPIQTLRSAAEAAYAAGVTPYGTPQTFSAHPEQNEEALAAAREDVGEQGKEAMKHPAYLAGNLLGTAAVTHGLSEGLPEVVPERATPGALREKVRGMVQNRAGAGARDVAETVKKEASKAAEAKDANTAKNQKADEATLESRGKTDEKNVGQLKKDMEARRKVLLENKQKTAEHQANVAETHEANKKELQRHEDRKQIEQKIDQASQELSQRVQQAEERANAENAAKWENVRNKTGDKSTPLAPLQSAAEIAAEKADPNTSAMIKRISQTDKAAPPVVVDGKTIAPGQPNYERFYEMQYGEPPPIGGGEAKFDQLHRWYNWVQDKMYSGGEMPAGTYQAYKILRNALDAGMQDIAKQAGATEDLADARASHTQLKETFSDSPNQKQTVATKFQQEASPEFQKQEAMKARAAKVAKYDPQVTSIAKHIDNLREAHSKLPKAAPLREIVKPLPDAPELKEPPAVRPPEPYEEPRANSAFEKQEVDTAEIRRQGIQKLANRLNLSGYDVGIVASSVAMGPLLEAIGHTASTGFRGAATAYVAGKAIMRSVLTNPAVVDWLAKPPAGELEILRKLPNADKLKLKNSLADAVDQAKKEGRTISVSPALDAALGTQGTVARTAGEAKKRAKAAQQQE